MYFNIQISNPTIYKRIYGLADSLEDAIEELFPEDTEDAFINWNGIRVALNYKYDLSVICEDIIDMLEHLIGHKKGTLVIEWPSNTFRTDWHLRWDDNSIDCEAQWFDVSGNIEEVLNSSNKISLSKKDFISEWAGIIKKISECILRAGYKAEQINSLERMIVVSDKITSYGKLYRHI